MGGKGLIVKHSEKSRLDSFFEQYNMQKVIGAVSVLLLIVVFMAYFVIIQTNLLPKPIQTTVTTTITTPTANLELQASAALNQQGADEELAVEAVYTPPSESDDLKERGFR
ncbi:MAG: hypothetical protein GOV15_01310 [Candidatus Diapherotrites archaeon]|nr:hypothetical protein [Candidatus Diapherotrites archaeon]